MLRAAHITPAHITLRPDSRDARRRLVSAEQVAQLAERHAVKIAEAEREKSVSRETDFPTMGVSTLAALQAELADLRRRVARLEARVQRPAPVGNDSKAAPGGDSDGPRYRAYREEYHETRPPAREHATVTSLRQGADLMPSSLVNWRAVARLHGIPSATVDHWTQSGKLPIVRAEQARGWRIGPRTFVAQAINAAGAVALHRLAGLPWPCDVCAAAGLVPDFAGGDAPASQEW